MDGFGNHRWHVTVNDFGYPATTEDLLGRPCVSFTLTDEAHLKFVSLRTRESRSAGNPKRTTSIAVDRPSFMIFAIKADGENDCADAAGASAMHARRLVNVWTLAEKSRRAALSYRVSFDNRSAT